MRPALQDALYDPFRRHDAYGCMGQGPLPLRESVRLALAAVFVLPVKVRLPDAACEALRWPAYDGLPSLHCCSSDKLQALPTQICFHASHRAMPGTFGCEATAGASATSHVKSTRLHP